MSSVTVIRRILTVGAAAALLLTTALVEVASAHGSTIDPMSRNYGCWKRWGNDFQNPRMATEDPMCWQAWQAESNAMWNWNGLFRDGVNGQYQTAVPDGTLCSGGGTSDGRYNALDVPGNWVATPLDNNFTMTVHDQARHGAVFYRVYVSRQGFNPLTTRLRWSDLELLRDTGPIGPGVGTPSTDPVLNGVSVAINVNAPGRTGRHIVFVLWLAAHSDQSYYWCSDVQFPGGNNPTPSNTASPSPSAPRPSSSSPGSSPPGSPGGPTSCAATVVVETSWPGGWQGQVTVRNTGNTPMTNWTASWQMPTGATLGHGWGATFMQTGATGMAHAETWNRNLAPGETKTAGFLANGTAAPPPSGATCA